MIIDIIPSPRCSCSILNSNAEKCTCLRCTCLNLIISVQLHWQTVLWQVCTARTVGSVCAPYPWFKGRVFNIECWIQTLWGHLSNLCFGIFSCMSIDTCPVCCCSLVSFVTTVAFLHLTFCPVIGYLFLSYDHLSCILLPFPVLWP